MSKSKWEVMVGTNGVYLNGLKLKKIGEGAARKVYSHKSLSVVLKLGDEYQCKTEMQTYRKSRGKLRKHLAKVHQYGVLIEETECNEGVSYSIMEKINGVILRDIPYPDRERIQENISYLNNKLTDIHDENLIVCSKRKIPICIDIGFGIH